MFIERLTKKHLITFFELEKFIINKNNFHCALNGNPCIPIKNYIEIDIHPYGTIADLTYKLYDFDCSRKSLEDKWRDFLYTIFGEEYKKAYKEYLQNSIEQRIALLEKIPELEEECDKDL